MVKKALSSCFIAILIFCTSVYAGELYSGEIRQIHTFADTLRIYADINDSAGGCVEDLKPADFALMLDNEKLTIKDAQSFKNTGDGIASIFLVDISRSLRDSQMQDLKNAMKKWVGNMSEKDMAAILTFGNDVNLVSDYSSDKEALYTAIDTITNNDNSTRLYGGINEALKLATRADKELPKRKSIMLITDGVNDFNGSLNEDDVYSLIKDELVPIYSLWLSNSKESNSAGQKTLNTITDYSCGKIFDLSSQSIESVYDDIQTQQMNTYVIDGVYNQIKPDGDVHALTIRAVRDSKTVEDSVNFRMTKTDEVSGKYMIDTESAPVENTSKDKNSNTMLWIVLIAVLVLVATTVIIVMVIYRRRSSRAEEEVEYNATSGMLTFKDIDDNTVTNVPLNTSVIIGRAQNNDFVINSSMVSGSHCAINCVAGKLFVEDLGSTNGTALNGKNITSLSVLNSGDRLTVGNKNYIVTWQL